MDTIVNRETSKDRGDHLVLFVVFYTLTKASAHHHVKIMRLSVWLNFFRLKEKKYCGSLLRIIITYYESKIFFSTEKIYHSGKI